MNRIKELREKKKLTQKELADKINITAGAVGNYERGKREPRPEIWKKFADFFGVSVDYLKGAWSKEEVLKLVQRTYLENLGYIEDTKKFRHYSLTGEEIAGNVAFYSESEEEYPLDDYVLPFDGNPELLAVSIQTYFESWLRFFNSSPSLENIAGMFIRFTSERPKNDSETRPLYEELNANLKLALYGKNRALVLNDSYIWRVFFAGLFDDELIQVLMKAEAPINVMLVAIRYTLNNDSDELTTFETREIH